MRNPSRVRPSMRPPAAPPLLFLLRSAAPPLLLPGKPPLRTRPWLRRRPHRIAIPLPPKLLWSEIWPELLAAATPKTQNPNLYTAPPPPPAVNRHPARWRRCLTPPLAPPSSPSPPPLPNLTPQQGRSTTESGRAIVSPRDFSLMVEVA
jgi:hypothetical protein